MSTAMPPKPVKKTQEGFGILTSLKSSSTFDFNTSSLVAATVIGSMAIAGQICVWTDSSLPVLTWSLFGAVAGGIISFVGIKWIGN